MQLARFGPDSGAVFRNPTPKNFKVYGMTVTPFHPSLISQNLLEGSVGFCFDL
jgi:hypothetical protein